MINKTLELWFLWSFFGEDTSLWLVDSVSTLDLSIWAEAQRRM
jgi:hypothetical protein